jgi:hypothetical protein
MATVYTDFTFFLEKALVLKLIISYHAAMFASNEDNKTLVMH